MTDENLHITPATAAPAGPAESAVGGDAATVKAGPSNIDETERSQRQAALDELMDLMRPAVQADGGDLVVTSVDFDAGVVSVELQGACGSCAVSSLTLKGGVERLLKQRLSWVTEVRGEVDDSMDIFESSALGRGGYVPKAAAR